MGTKSSSSMLKAIGSKIGRSQRGSVRVAGTSFCVLLNVPFETERKSRCENETDSMKAENCLCDKDNLRGKKDGVEEKEPVLKHQHRNKDLEIVSSFVFFFCFFFIPVHSKLNKFCLITPSGVMFPCLMFIFSLSPSDDYSFLHTHTHTPTDKEVHGTGDKTRPPASQR